MAAPTNIPNFNSGVQGAAWFLVGTPPVYVVVTQFDALVRRFQRNMLEMLPTTYPSTLRPGNSRNVTHLAVDGLFGEEGLDALAEAMRRAGYADEIPDIVAQYRRGTLSARAVANLIFFSVFVRSVGTPENPRVFGSVPRPQIGTPAGMGLDLPALLRGSTRVRSDAQIQNFIGYYDPATATATNSSEAAATAIPLGPEQLLYLPGQAQQPIDITPPPLNGAPARPATAPAPTPAETAAAVAAAPAPSPATGAGPTDNSSLNNPPVAASPVRAAPAPGATLPDVNPETDGVPISKNPQRQIFGYAGGIPDWGWGLILAGSAVAVTGVVVMSVRAAKRSNASAKIDRVAQEKTASLPSPKTELVAKESEYTEHNWRDTTRAGESPVRRQQCTRCGAVQRLVPGLRPSWVYERGGAVCRRKHSFA